MTLEQKRKTIKALRDFRPGMEEDDRWPVALIAIGVTAVIVLIVCAAIAGLTYPYWKQFIHI